MSEDSNAVPHWWARGLLFENCSCLVVCPGHVHFEQLCTFDPCVGCWTLRFDEGEFGDVALGGVRAVVAYRSPQRMIDGNWIEVFIIDEEASPEQREAIETILSGAAGGPWQVLDRFVEKRMETLYLPIRIEEEERSKSVVIEGVLDSTVEAIRGRDRSKPVTFENIFNQIHSPSQVIARGDTRYEIGELVVNNEGTHGLWSNFDWSVSPE